ncbi:hypothetical protein RRG08_049664 [Elysia crispata]|uniref:Reverse transcriptase domain-containing protein n=1 Tax=Elysia crispata TaxID=231223 RepID=A0AAE0Y600_9GAST|nr:hypothetical protein RRG08_049664 [Elysia crispata]
MSHDDLKSENLDLARTLQAIKDRLPDIETRLDSGLREPHPQPQSSPTVDQADQTQSQDTPAPAQGLGPDSNLPSSIAYDSDNAFLDIQRQFESLRDRLSRIQIPSYCKVNDSAVGIKSQDRLQILELTPSEVGATHSTLPILIPDDLISSTIVEVPREWTFPRHDETTPSSIHDPVCISVVPKRSGDFRLILDLRRVNTHCVPRRFSYTDINSALEIVDPDDLLVTLDIKSGFHHIKVHPEHTQYLGFKFEGIYYKFVVLPFGLNCSPYYFHKCVRPVIEHLVDKGIKCVVCVDDFLLSDTSDRINASKSYLISVLETLGWFINYDKSSLHPEPRKSFIGFIIDTNRTKDSVWIEIPKDRIRKVRNDIARVFKRKSVTARGLARITG